MINPTFRKVREQGHTPIRYRTENEARNGCIIEKFPQYWLVRLVGEKVTGDWLVPSNDMSRSYRR
ncbi:MAG: hypothetical protein O7D91_02140 [Planctomycetota bacterium]|nr:hypothetical protein [Planctomycetota bacterium]